MVISRKAVNDVEYGRIILGSSCKGNQAKYTNGKFWIKTNYLGYEDYAEYIVSKLLECSNIENFVKYDLCTFRGEKGCISRNMLEANESLITFTKILNKFGYSQKKLDAMNTVEERFNITVEIIEKDTGLDLREYLSNLLTLDAITRNEDRHLNNLAVVYNEVTDSYREVPIFDNGLSLLSDCNDYRFEVGLNINLRRVKARPFSSSFSKQLAVLSPTIVFDKNKVQDLVNNLSETDDICIKRISEVLKYSMREYSKFFIDLDENRPSSKIKAW